uniref:RRM domain-containing protein n=1 Tax=Guillardia theta TaxID=55529 RepID=A0A7S4P314_GUITH|mmetsp:Transcript_42208/g.132960  ORF Transcript_42208/g.132960 Transcript_42208/m.132960 type:complete len:139 (+) Transcript_42208:163-579(+)
MMVRNSAFVDCRVRLLSLLLFPAIASCSSQLDSWRVSSRDHHDRGSQESSASIFVKNLDSELTEKDLLCIFEQFGSVKKISIPQDRSRVENRRFAIIEFVDPRSALLARDNMQGVKIGRNVLRVEQQYRRPPLRARRF